MNNLKISDAGIGLIANFEGKRNSIYIDAVGFPTIGIGHLIKKNESFPEIMTDQEVNELFREDIKKRERSVNTLVTVELNQNQFDALLSLVFNIGTGAFATSTLLKKLNNGRVQEAADQFLRWDQAGGKPLLGLTRRRKAEKEVFETPVAAAGSFKDVRKSDWFYNSVELVQSEGLMSGYPDKTFKPEKLVSRAELAIVLDNVLSKIER